MTPKRLAAFLTQQGISATFKLVGEKGRVLERRGRRDVIEGLARHEIGYHSNTHSQHPTVAEYEATLDWESGVREFTRRERPGFEDLRRIFGRAPTCYGQPGSSWAPQAYAALKEWGAHVYLDEGSHVGLNGRPFWYGGLLNIFNTVEGPRLRPNGDWSNLAGAKAEFHRFYMRVSSQRGGGIISIYFHPTEFVHREFWDAVNFAHGANPGPEEWKLPPIRSLEESERAFRYFEGLVAYMKSFPRVEFLTASEGLRLLKDPAQGRAFSPEELLTIAKRVDADLSFQVHENFTLSASEVFSLLTQFVAGVLRKKASGPIRLSGTPFGPSLSFAAGMSVSPLLSPALRPLHPGTPGPTPNGGAKSELPWNQFASTVLDVAGFLDNQEQIPSVVWFGSTAVSPEAYLLALAQVTRTLFVKGEPPKTVTINPARLAAAEYVADDSPALWDWVIFPIGFRAPNLMTIAKLQAWTLKPATFPRGTASSGKVP